MYLRYSIDNANSDSNRQCLILLDRSVTHQTIRPSIGSEFHLLKERKNNDDDDDDDEDDDDDNNNDDDDNNGDDDDDQQQNGFTRVAIFLPQKLKRSKLINFKNCASARLFKRGVFNGV